MYMMITVLFIIRSKLTYLSSSNIRCNNILLINSSYNTSQEYIPLHYTMQKSLIITNPCHVEQSIFVQNHTLYGFQSKQLQWKRLCIAHNSVDEKIPIVNSIAYLNSDIILLIHGILYRTQDIISSTENDDIIYRISRYSNISVLFEKIDYVFTTPCCICYENISYHSTSQIYNDYVILANKNGDVNLFHLPSMAVAYNFENIFQSQSICQSNQCDILYLGLFHTIPILMCIVKYKTEKAIIYHRPFLEFTSSFQNSTFLNLTDGTLYITPTTFPNAFFFWDTKKIYYTPNGGLTLSEVTLNGCQFDYLDNMNENQLKAYYNDLEIDYDNITLLTKDMFCSNLTIDYIIISNREFYLQTENNYWLYGKESFFPSIMKLPLDNECIPLIQDQQNLSMPYININISQCLANLNLQIIPCSSFAQSFCSYLRFEPLFDTHQLYILEKNSREEFQFILEAYTIIPIMISSIESAFFDYSVNYKINYINNGIIQIIGVKQNIVISTRNQTSDLYGSSLSSFRLGLIQYDHACTQTPTFAFQVEASCSTDSVLRVKSDNEFEVWNQYNPVIDIEWIEQNLPINAIHQFSPIYIKHKQNDPLLLNYQYCFNNICQSIDDHELKSLIIYAIPINKEHDDYARYLINRTDTCIPFNQSIYELWLQWTLNMTDKTQHFQIPYERRTFYRTLLNISLISNQSCLFFNGSDYLHINNTLNQVSNDYLKFLIHIIAYNTKYSYCDLETFLLLEIEPIHHIQTTYRGFAFLITLFIFILSFILFLYIYTYYKQHQRKTSLEYHRLNQIDAGQFHQWYDIARYLNENRNTTEYHLIHTHLQNLQPTTNLTKRLMEYHKKPKTNDIN
ncbi:hypothetical protein I4U23_019556 [Adineta vaga]|nr:hypothetical protein I4U23_019556 [Adineta vaga]